MKPVFAFVLLSLASLPGRKDQIGTFLVRIERPEGRIAGPLERLARAHPQVSAGSYPFSAPGIYGADIVLRSRDPAALAAAMEDLRRMADALLAEP